MAITPLPAPAGACCAPRPGALPDARRTALTPGALAALRLLVLAVVALSLLSGIAGGLLRAGVAVPGTGDTLWPGRVALAHAALMMGGFLGTVIGIERAVAVKLRAAFAAPVASGLGGL
ncbi:MAG: hypothetical protein JWP77_662, partial [Polaromonas sp.]|nr:hypothetical protein [Polaromonas sp.]